LSVNLGRGAACRNQCKALLENLKPFAHKQGRQSEQGTMIRILLAEDDRVMREYLTRALERSGYAVSAVDRGTAAIPLLESEPFDLLLTDIVMPEMDGIELAQKAGEMCPDLRVMFITGFAAVTLKAGKTVPQARVLSKPFHLRDLVMEVDRMFEMENMTRGV
jgi:two-component system cell cycle response regulator CpdR